MKKDIYKELIDTERKAKAITPFDAESVEKLDKVSVKIDPKRKINIVDKFYGEQRFIE